MTIMRITTTLGALVTTEEELLTLNDEPAVHPTPPDPGGWNPRLFDARLRWLARSPGWAGVDGMDAAFRLGGPQAIIAVADHAGLGPFDLYPGRSV